MLFTDYNFTRTSNQLVATSSVYQTEEHEVVALALVSKKRGEDWDHYDERHREMAKTTTIEFIRTTLITRLEYMIGSRALMEVNHLEIPLQLLPV